MSKNQFFLLIETIARGFKQLADVVEAGFQNQDRDFQERVLLAIKESKKPKKK